MTPAAPAPATGAARRARAAALAATGVLLLAGTVLLVLAGRLDDSAGRNRALTDGAATRQVIEEVTAALDTVLSYSPDTAGDTERAAAALLTGEAARQHRDLFTRVRDQIDRQGLAVTTRVVRAGVVRLTGDTAELLVFLDQTGRRPDGGPPATAAAQLAVTARLDHGRWRITAIASR
ncbi:nuclear transport factor 2 family protein [Streptomyces sp. YIM 98790]|uniref:nuclear transport factor 2 family protein n=1 Tax=Streptomyces sp. YIM 98790 TaxID=2689077 RepID=UPI00140C3788|nr:nuclear transport factor 2 family protein [Streptomyces sp. YIM 98790]